MIQPPNYKNRTVEVRRAARSHLLELRKARTEKRKHTTGTLSARDAAVSGPVGEAMSEHVANDKQIPALPIQEPEPLQALEAEAAPATRDDPPGADIDMLADDLDDVAIKNAAMAELMDEDVEVSDEPVEETDAARQQTGLSEMNAPQELTAEEIPPSETPEAVPNTDDVLLESAEAENRENPCDLEALPGAGQGLIWMLNQCGIHCLADLAAKDADELVPKLGVVGQILDVERWIVFAQDQLEHPSSG